MQHEDESDARRATPDGPQTVWQSLHRLEEPGMEMKLTADELRALARFKQKENVLFPWILSPAFLAIGALFVYGAIKINLIWLRIGLVWLAVLAALGIWGTIRVGARRMEMGESCAQFMVRELEGGRRTALAARWGIVAALPAILMIWWGSWGGIRTNAAQLGPVLWRHSLVTNLERLGLWLVLLLAAWVGLGREARKKSRQAEEFRRDTGVQT